MNQPPVVHQGPTNGGRTPPRSPDERWPMILPAPPPEDRLRPARGILWGVLLGAALWGLLILLWRFGL